jgi:hypothetical protein
LRIIVAFKVVRVLWGDRLLFEFEQPVDADAQDQGIEIFRGYTVEK